MLWGIIISGSNFADITKEFETMKQYKEAEKSDIK